MLICLITTEATKAMQTLYISQQGCYSDRAGEEVVRWDTLMQQVRMFKQYVYDPTIHYQPYLIR